MKMQLHCSTFGSKMKTKYFIQANLAAFPAELSIDWLANFIFQYMAIEFVVTASLSDDPKILRDQPRQTSNTLWSWPKTHIKQHQYTLVTTALQKWFVQGVLFVCLLWVAHFIFKYIHQFLYQTLNNVYLLRTVWNAVKKISFVPVHSLVLLFTQL